MVSEAHTDGIVAQRLQHEQYEKNFADLHPVLSRHDKTEIFDVRQ